MEGKYRVNHLLMIPNYNNDNYINIPEKILDSLTKKKYNLPFYFKLSANNGLYVYVGVKEFTAPSKTLEVPSHIIQYLGTEHANLRIISEIPKGEFIKLKTNDETFYDLPDYDKFLEAELSKYCLLDINQNIIVTIMDKEYTFEINEMKIKVDEELLDYHLIDIVNVDLKVDFERKIKEEIKESKVKEISDNLVKFNFGDEKEVDKELNYFDKLEDKGSKISYNHKELSKEEIRLQRLKYFSKSNKEDL